MSGRRSRCPAALHRQQPGPGPRARRELHRIGAAPNVIYRGLIAVDLDRADVSDIYDRSSRIEIHVVGLDNEAPFAQPGHATGKALDAVQGVAAGPRAC